MVIGSADTFHDNAAFLNHGIIKNEVSLHIGICGIITYDAEEGFHRAIKMPAPVYLGTCKETIELVLDSFDEWRKLMMEWLVGILTEETEDKEVLEQIQYDAPFSFFILSLRSDCPNLNLSNNDRK